MRFLKRDLKPVYVFAKSEVDSGYVGKKVVDNYSHKVYANIQPADSKITVESYGERAYNMVSIMCSSAYDISYKISLTDTEKPTHKVVSVKEYTNHKVILAEVII